MRPKISIPKGIFIRRLLFLGVVVVVSVTWISNHNYQKISRSPAFAVINWCKNFLVSKRGGLAQPPNSFAVKFAQLFPQNSRKLNSNKPAPYGYKRFHVIPSKRIPFDYPQDLPKCQVILWAEAYRDAYGQYPPRYLKIWESPSFYYELVEIPKDTDLSSYPRDVVDRSMFRYLALMDTASPKGFETGRGLDRYLADIGEARLSHAFRNLGPDDQYMDAGCGGGLALYDLAGEWIKRYKTSTRFPKLLGVRYQDGGRSPPFNFMNFVHEAYGPKFRMLSGRRFDEISLLEIGKNKLIVDEVGILPYSPDPGATLNRYLSSLEFNGEIAITAPREMVIEDNGELIPWGEYLKRYPGIEVDVTYKKVGYYESREAQIIWIRKTSETASVASFETKRFLSAANPIHRLLAVVQP